MAVEGENPSSTSDRHATGRASAHTIGRRRRSSIKVPILALVLVVAVCAMAVTALRTASQPWHAATYTFTVFLLLTAVLASRYRRGNERAFWFGFAVFGWGFFVLGYQPWMSAFGYRPDRAAWPLNPDLLTSRFILFLLPHLRKPTTHLGMIDPITLNTLGIAHLLVTLLVGLVGGGLGLLLRWRSRGRVSVHLLAMLTGLMLVAAVAISIDTARPTVRYFPAGIFEEDRELSDFIDEWYSKHLAAMGEPSLSTLAERDGGAIVYRLLWLPSFHHSVCVRVEAGGDGLRLRATALDGKGGDDPGRIAIERSLSLSIEQWEEIERLVEKSSLWELPTRVDDGGCDGDQLIVEGVREGKYHIVDRWEPDPDYKALCRHLLALMNLDVSKQWSDYHSEGEVDDPG